MQPDREKNDTQVIGQLSYLLYYKIFSGSAQAVPFFLDYETEIIVTKTGR